MVSFNLSRNHLLLPSLALLALASVSCWSAPSDAGNSSIVPAKVVSFTASPSKIENGSKVMLRWEVINADTVVIDHGIGEVLASGSIEVKPSDLTAYNLTATNQAGSVGSAVIVNVTPFIRVASPASDLSSGSRQMTENGLPRLGPNESYVFFQKAVMVGADEHLIVLKNNPKAHNPTWEELKAFLKDDSTDRHEYIQGKFTCGDFAEMLHNNAEAAGLRAAVVAIELVPPNMPGGVINHSLNAFETTDRGLVYIDDTSSTAGFFADKQAKIALGDEYVCVSLWVQPGQLQTWPSMGKIQAIDIFQW